MSTELFIFFFYFSSSNFFLQKVKVEEKENLDQNRGFKVKKEEVTEVKTELQPEGWTLKSEAEKVPEIKVDPGKLPMIKNDKGEKVLRMYWLDAFEDVYKHPGTGNVQF